MTGRIKDVIQNRNFGFIKCEDGKEYFFHRDDFEDDWRNMEIDFHQKKPIDVEFEPTPSNKGLRASKVMRTVLLLLLLLVPSLASAQTHPCDQPELTQQSTKSGPNVLSWCWIGQDETGDPAVPTQWAVIVDGTRTVLTNVTKGTTPNSLGKFQYTTPYTFVKGPAKTFVIEVTTVDGTAQALPLSVTVTGAPPKKPDHTRIGL